MKGMWMQNRWTWWVVCVLGIGADAWAGAPHLGIVRVDSEIRVSWTDAGFLEQADSVGGPWTEVAGAQNPHVVSAKSAPQFFRLRAAHALTVERSGTGKGRVQSNPGGIDCGSDCTEIFDSGTRVVLEAVPEGGSTFEGWTGDCTGTGPCEIRLDEDRRVQARFGAAPVATTGFVNGDFEQGPNVGWLQEPGNMIYSAEELQVAPYLGRYAAWVGYHPDNRRRAAIGQRVTLPAAPPIYLNFAIWLYSEELCDPPWWDTFGVYVDGEPLEENSHLCRGNTGGDGWRRLSFDMSFLAGRTLLIGFEISSVDALASVALIDSVAIASAPW